MTSAVSFLSFTKSETISTVNSSPDGTKIVLIGKSDSTRTVYYSKDSGANFNTQTITNYKSYNILGTSSCVIGTKFYVFYWTDLVKDSNDITLPYLLYDTTNNIITEQDLGNIISANRIYCLSVNTNGTGLSIGKHNTNGYDYIDIISAQSGADKNLFNGTNTSLDTGRGGLSYAPTQISTSLMVNDIYHYCFFLNTANELYSSGYYDSSQNKITSTKLSTTGNYYYGISNIIKISDISYVAYVIYTANSFSVRISQLKYNKNDTSADSTYITIEKKIAYSDDYATYSTITGLHLSSYSASNANFLAAYDPTGISYFNGLNIYRYDSAMTNGGSFTSCSGSYSETLSQQIIYASNGSNYIYKISEIVCFLQGTKLTIFENNEEIEKNIENLKIGDLVKTEQDIYKKINFIGYQNIDIVDNIKYLNVLKKDSISENLPYEDLYLTTGHSLLFKDLKYANKYYNKNSYNNNIKNFYKIMAQHCSLCNYITKSEIKNYINNDEYVKVYNFSLESEDPSSQYAVYSNGIRSECMSYEYAINKSNMSPL